MTVEISQEKEGISLIATSTHSVSVMLHNEKKNVFFYQFSSTELNK